MDERNAMLWQLIQSLGHQMPEAQPAGHPHQVEQAQPEHYLLTLRPLMPPRQQRIIDLMIKFQELRALIEELHMH